MRDDVAPDTLESLLDATRAALLAGDLDALAALSLALETALDGAPLTAAQAAALRDRADRNARLIAAASRGVRAARRRLAEVTACQGLVTYDAAGRRDVVAAPALPVRRA